jgi:hypothetical protein
MIGFVCAADFTAFAETTGAAIANSPQVMKIWGELGGCGSLAWYI